MLLDYAQAVAGEACLACPEGRSPTRRAPRRAARADVPRRRPNLRARRDRLLAPARLLAHGRELRALAADLDARRGRRLGHALGDRRPGPARRHPVAFAHHDLLPGPLAAAAVRAAARRARVVVVPSRTVGRDLDPAAGSATRLRIVNPGDRPRPLRRRSTRRRRRPRSSCSARSSAGRRPSSRWRRSRWPGARLPSCACGSSASRCRRRRRRMGCAMRARPTSPAPSGSLDSSGCGRRVALARASAAREPRREPSGWRLEAARPGRRSCRAARAGRARRAPRRPVRPAMRRRPWRSSTWAAIPRARLVDRAASVPHR